MIENRKRDGFLISNQKSAINNLLHHPPSFWTCPGRMRPGLRVCGQTDSLLL